MPLGVNTINRIMKNMSQAVGLDTILSITASEKLPYKNFKKGGAATDIMAITGHKNHKNNKVWQTTES